LDCGTTARSGSGLVALVHSLYVAACAEGPAVAGDHHHAHVVVGCEHRQDLGEPGVHGVAQRIASVGSVECDDTEMAVDLSEEVGRSSVEIMSHLSSLAAR
jgi:hypothetical protein